MPAAYEVTVIIFKYISLSLLKKEKKTTHRGKWKKRFLKLASCYCCSVAKLCPILWPHELQHARLPCPSLSPRVCLNSCPLNRWCHPTISSSATPFCPQSFPASVSFPVSLLFASGDQNIGSFIFSISPSNEYSGLIPIRLDWFDLLAVQGTLKSHKKTGGRALTTGKFKYSCGPGHGWIQNLRQHLQVSPSGSLLTALLSSV